MTQRLNILLSAYACEPDKGSEPGVGWNWTRQIALFNDVWVITRLSNKESIERALAQAPTPNIRWIYFDFPWWTRFWKKGERGVHLYYYLWQLGAYVIGKRLHREVNFDLVHHLTFGIDWIPSFLAFLPVPFVWGPIVGAQSVNSSFRCTLPWKDRFQEQIRSFARQFSRIDPFVRRTACRAALGVASTAEAAQHLLGLGCKKVIIQPSVGMSNREIEKYSFAEAVNKTNDNLRFLSIGKLLAFKGFCLAMRAFAQVQLRFPLAEWWIIGDGPDRDRLMCLSHQMGVNSKVHFLGWMPRQEVLIRLLRCDVLVHPCLRGAISMVCLEAMAVGRPVICLDLGGPALQVTDETGFKVSAITPEQVVNDLAEAMLQLAGSPEHRKRMGESAQKRLVECFDWNKKGEWIREVYQEVVTSRCTQ